MDDDDEDSGPFCSHWCDPSDCTEVCKGCGHSCFNHRYDECFGDDGNCLCKGFVGDDK